MPRAFLITHRRYNGTEEFEAPGRDYSPERGVRVAEYGGGQPTSDGVSDCGSETSSECPEELYNLTKLAEVSLAAAAGTLIHPSKVLAYQRPSSPRWPPHHHHHLHHHHHHHHHREPVEIYSSPEALEDSSRQSLRPQSSPSAPRREDGELSLRERTRLFFERIESEREILEERDERSSPELLKVRISRDSSPSRSHLEDETSRLTGSPAASFLVDQSHEESSKIIGSALPRKSASSHSVSSSEGSKSDDSEDHECPDCGKKYSTSSNLARHRQTHRSLGDKKARRCPHCDKIYVSMPAFSMHVRTHNQGCKCHYCGKCFSRPWLLQGHIRTHTGEKPFKCTICNKAFADKSNLRAHVQTHSNTKPHVCGRCGKAFALKSYLYKHEESSCMRAHNRSIPEKREGSGDSCGAVGVAASSASSPPGRQLQTPPVTASPTSVIVPRPGASRDSRDDSPAAFSTIIRHTKNQVVAPEAAPAPPTKRQCRDKVTSNGEDKTKEPMNKGTEFLSRMVIRTSVISPNPEHLVSRLGNQLNVKKTTPFDFADPARSSAFSRPAGISLNLAIA